jgi:hypothetical protein
MQSSRRLLLERLANFVHKQHPLPLDPRQSEQLLRTLTQSFQRHLDHHHPKRPSSHSQHQNALQRSSLGQSSESSFASVDNHVQSILTNPIVAGKPGLLNHLFSGLDVWSISALAMIQDHLAHGTLSIKTFDTCLQVLWRDQASNPDMQRMAVASKLVEWVNSTKQLSMATILQNKSCRLHLVDLLVRENQSGLVLQWIRQENINPSLPPALATSLVKSEIRHHGLARAVQVVTSHFLCPESITRHHVMASRALFALYRAMLTPAGPELLELSVYQQFRDVVFDNYLANDSSSTIHHVMLELIHPSKPSANAAYAYLQRIPTAEAFQSNMAKQGWRTWHLKLCLSTARLLIADEEFGKAEEMMEFAKNFPHELGLDLSSSKEPLSAVLKPSAQVEDAALLQRLDGLLAT